MSQIPSQFSVNNLPSATQESKSIAHENLIGNTMLLHSNQK